MTNNMTKEQIERYLNILEEKNKIAERVEDKMLTRSDNFDLKHSQHLSLNDIAHALNGLIDIAEAINNND
jgi:hypothetical protein|tara:strand:- start:2516 stop:2725 length:210 start_codon:yes stop_codon:yes gene_type:complete